MDETDKATQDAKTSGSGGTTTPGSKEKTYTEQEVTKMVSDIKAAAGRKQKELTDLVESANKTATEANKRLSEIQQRIDEAELEKARDNPELLKLYQQKQELEKAKANLDEERRTLQREQAQFKEEKEAVASAKTEAMIVEVALKYHVSIEDLEDLGITDQESLEKIAAKLAKSKPSTTEESGEIKPDSGLGTGESEPTPEQLNNMSMDKYVAHRKKQNPKFI